MAFRIITAVSAFALMTLSAASVFAASDPLAAAPAVRSDTKTIIVGSADFPESQLLATIYAKALSGKGIAVETKMSIGSREVYMPALLDGSIDLLPEYAGASLELSRQERHSPFAKRSGGSPQSRPAKRRLHADAIVSAGFRWRCRH